MQINEISSKVIEKQQEEIEKYKEQVEWGGRLSFPLTSSKPASVSYNLSERNVLRELETVNKGGGDCII